MTGAPRPDGEARRRRARLAVAAYPLAATGWLTGWLAASDAWAGAGIALFVVAVLLVSRLRPEASRRSPGAWPRQVRALAATAGLPATPVLAVVHLSLAAVLVGVVLDVRGLVAG